MVEKILIKPIMLKWGYFIDIALGTYSSEKGGMGEMGGGSLKDGGINTPCKL